MPVWLQAGLWGLTLEASPDVLRYRRWYLDSFVSQCAGGAPQPWTGPAR